MNTSEPKYTLSDVTKEEQDAFMKEFNALIEKYAMYFEPCPQYTRKDFQSPWEVTCSILLQKKTLVESSDTVEVLPVDENKEEVNA